VEPVVEEVLEVELEPPDDELELLEVLLELDAVLDEELLEDELEELDELDPMVPSGAEHSFTPPGTMVPEPKVTSPQTKLPLNSLKVN
jgi:hypothetical protein